MQILTDIRNRLEQEKGRYQQLVSESSQTKVVLESLKEEALNIEQASIILRTVAQSTQEQLSWYINDMVTAAIDSIFPDDNFSFFLEFVQRRGKTEADLYLADAKGNRIKPSDADGGGLVNVVAFALRVSLWSLGKSSRPVLILDEPVHFLHSRDSHRRFAELLKTISEKLHLQIIMITGEDESEEIISTADKVFEIENGKVKNRQ